MAIKKSTTLNNFIEKANKIHNNRYNYSLVKYKNSNTKIIIICPEHGEFHQLPYVHLRGSTCPKCSTNNMVGGYNFTRLNRDPILANKNSTLYLIRHEDLYKIGITVNKISHRFNRSIQIISRINNIKLIEAFTKEQEILVKYSRFKEPPKHWKYNGNSEFLNITPQQVKQIISEYF